jgi:hypothetical protein
LGGRLASSDLLNSVNTKKKKNADTKTNILMGFR